MNNSMIPQLSIAPIETSGFAANEGAVTKAKEALDALGDVLSEALQPLHDKVIATAKAVDEVEVELALAFEGGLNWKIVSVSGSASVKVKLVWRNPKA